MMEEFNDQSDTDHFDDEIIEIADPKPPHEQIKRRKTPRKVLYPEWTTELILEHVDAYFDAHGKWPSMNSGPIAGSVNDTWCGLNVALYQGCRGLPGGSSLSLLLLEHRGKRKYEFKRRLKIDAILNWADAHFESSGEWPNADSCDSIPESPEDSWHKVDGMLRLGGRGLPGGTSLPGLLFELRSVRSHTHCPRFDADIILKCADSYFQANGKWPNIKSGALAEYPEETWAGLNSTMSKGLRGFKSKTTLAKLLQERRSVRNRKDAPKLTVEKILAWADTFHQHTGSWPKCYSGHVADDQSESWAGIEAALSSGLRGLPGRSSLAKLFAERRAVWNRVSKPRLTEQQVMDWAKAHFKRTGSWPKVGTGAVFESPRETWNNISVALMAGDRGLPGGRPLARLLQEELGVSHPLDREKFCEDEILAWADSFHGRTGNWPTRSSGDIIDAPGVHPGIQWSGVDAALVKGLRSLEPGRSLAQLLAAKRGARNQRALPDFRIELIVEWVDKFRTHHGRWPTCKEGAIEFAPDESWGSIESAFKRGSRGLEVTGCNSLATFLDKYYERKR